jgi:hypothetical protein
MPKTMIETSPDAAQLAHLGVDRWPVWESEIAEFPWAYADMETSYIPQGRVIVTPEGREPVEIVTGDLVMFPAGMACTWKVVEPLRKRHRFG